MRRHENGAPGGAGVVIPLSTRLKGVIGDWFALEQFAVVLCEVAYWYRSSIEPHAIFEVPLLLEVQDLLLWSDTPIVQEFERDFLEVYSKMRTQCTSIYMCIEAVEFMF